jgi:hypothetical protein
MKDDSAGPDDGTTAEAHAYKEAAERERRLQVWLKGVLAKGPPPDDVVTQWREGIEIYSAAPDLRVVEDADNSPASSDAGLEQQLVKIRRRIRERRESAGKPPIAITQEESEMRAAHVLDAVRADLTEVKRPTPLFLVLAARYMEGEMNFGEFSQAVLGL